MSRLRFFVNSAAMLVIAVVGFGLLLSNQPMNNGSLFFLAVGLVGTVGAGYIAGYFHATERKQRRA